MSGAGMSSAEAAPFQVIAILLVIGNQDRGRFVADLIRERANDDRLDVRMLAQFVFLLVANEHLEKDFAVRLILLGGRPSFVQPVWIIGSWRRTCFLADEFLMIRRRRRNRRNRRYRRGFCRRRRCRRVRWGANIYEDGAMGRGRRRFGVNRHEANRRR